MNITNPGIRFIALRETAKGYRLTQLSINLCDGGEYRKYSNDTDLFYKRWNYAKDSCIQFYSHHWNGKIKYYGTISNDMFRGEIAQESEVDLFKTDILN